MRVTWRHETHRLKDMNITRKNTYEILCEWSLWTHSFIVCPFIYGLTNKTDFIMLLILVVQELKIKILKVVQIPLKC